MRVLYIDFSEGSEDLSVTPNRYGGAQIVPSWCRELMDEFWCLGMPESFESLGIKEKKDKCLVVPRFKLQDFRRGESLQKHVADWHWDLIFHNAPDVWINTNIPQCVWAPGYAERVHPNHKYVLCHSPAFQMTQIPERAKMIPVQIGKPVPEFQVYRKEDFIFQCTNHAPCFQSIQLVQLCNKHKIRCYLGGPISEGYPLLNYIDNQNTFYLGVMSYKEKIEMTKRARIHTLLHNIPINFTLSGLEALAYGCALIVTPVGFWPSFINDKIGRLINSEQTFLNAYESTRYIDQIDCWTKAKEYDNVKMVESFKKAFEKVLNG